MMAKIYDPPKEMETPDFTYDQNGHPDINKYEEDNEKYIEELRIMLSKERRYYQGQKHASMWERLLGFLLPTDTLSIWWHQ